MLAYLTPAFSTVVLSRWAILIFVSSLPKTWATPTGDPDVTSPVRTVGNPELEYVFCGLFPFVRNYLLYDPLITALGFFPLTPDPTLGPMDSRSPFPFWSDHCWLCCAIRVYSVSDRIHGQTLPIVVHVVYASIYRVLLNR